MPALNADDALRPLPTGYRELYQKLLAVAPDSVDEFAAGIPNWRARRGLEMVLQRASQCS